MRFGISATSSILPKNLRTRLRPVNVCAIVGLVLRRALCGDGFPTADGRAPGEVLLRPRPGGCRRSAPLWDAPATLAIRPQPPNRMQVQRRYAPIVAIPGVTTPESLEF